MFLKFLVNRLFYVIPILFITTLIVFSFILLIPGDPVLVILGENATPEREALLREQLGLNQPIIVQYFNWLTSAVQGDLGRSIITGQLVHEAVFGRFIVTFQLVVMAVLFAVISGMFLAIISVYTRSKIVDYLVRLISTVGSAIPNFWLSMLLILLFSLILDWFPATGFVGINEDPILFLKTTFLPAISLGAIGTAQITRHLRSQLMETQNTDYLRTAYSKGITKWQAIFNHALRNAMLPVVTTIGILFGNLLGATVVIETVFGIPGMGQLAVNSILQRDFPLLQGVVLIMIVLVIIINFITDIIYSILDPRIEY